MLPDVMVALTGGVGAGKSTVAAMLAQRGAVIVDADAMAREVVQRATPGFEQVVAEFGVQIVGPDGELDRAKLADIVFNDKAALERLNAIVHPAVGRLSAQRLAAVSSDQIVIYDVPLLAERGSRDGFQVVIVVESTMPVRLARLAGRGMSEESARARMAVQATDEQRRAIATYVVDNSGSLAELEAQVDRIWAHLNEGGLEPAESIR